MPKQTISVEDFNDQRMMSFESLFRTLINDLVNIKVIVRFFLYKYLIRGE